MPRPARVGRLLVVALGVALVAAPAIADAGPRRSGAPRVRSGSTWRGARPQIRDHRTYRAPRPTYGRGVYYPRGYRYTYAPYPYWPRYWFYYGYGPRYAYWPMYPDGYYASPAAAYAVPPTSEVVTLQPPPLRPRFGLSAHLGQLQREDGEIAGFAALGVRWRGPVVEAELEVGRRVYSDEDVRERSLAATLYVNLGRRDALHPYVLGGAGLLGRDRMFGAIGGGIAVPVGTRFTIAGDLRAAAVRARDEMQAETLDTSTLEGRLSAIVDF